MCLEAVRRRWEEWCCRLSENVWSPAPDLEAWRSVETLVLPTPFPQSSGEPGRGHTGHPGGPGRETDRDRHGFKSHLTLNSGTVKEAPDGVTMHKKAGMETIPSLKVGAEAGGV